jgi:putative YphP/YqiW family bacilliredoxin
MFPEHMIRPMREELTTIGFREMRTPGDVDDVVKRENGTVLIVVNSVCGCAAGRARPAVASSLSNPARPDVLATVFAGQDREATEQARTYFTGYAPSSPSIALMQNGKVVFMLERHQIEGRDPRSISTDLTKAYDRFCSPVQASAQ